MIKDTNTRISMYQLIDDKLRSDCEWCKDMYCVDTFVIMQSSHLPSTSYILYFALWLTCYSIFNYFEESATLYLSVSV